MIGLAAVEILRTRAEKENDSDVPRQIYALRTELDKMRHEAEDAKKEIDRLRRELDEKRKNRGRLASKRARVMDSPFPEPMPKKTEDKKRLSDVDNKKDKEEVDKSEKMA